MSWPLVKLEDVCNFVRGPFGGALKKDSFVERGFAVYEQQHAIYNQFTKIRYHIDANKFEDLKRFELRAGDLIMSCSGTMGKVAKVPRGIKKGIINQALLKLTPSSKMDLNFLAYWMGSDLFQNQLSDNSHGAAIKNVASVKILKQLRIPCPQRVEQQKIVAILDAADQLRQKDQQLIEHYTALGQSLFLEMFGDPVSNPKGWIRTEFGCIFNSIKYGVSTPPKYSISGIPFIRATNIKKGSVVTKGMVYISLDESKKITKCKLSEGDLIIVRSGANTGDCGRIPSEYVDAFGGFDMIIDIDDPYSTFYNFLLNTGAGKAILKPLTRRAGQPHLNSKQISSLSLIAPPVSLQNQFVENLQVIETQKQQAQAALDKSETLFNSLLQRAFKGELTQSDKAQPLSKAKDL